jgi:hypothetical protein
MYSDSDGYGVTPDVVAAAREIIRNRDGGCLIGMRELLHQMNDKPYEHFSADQVLDLIEELWDDPHVGQVTDTPWVEFAWNEAGRY